MIVQTINDETPHINKRVNILYGELLQNAHIKKPNHKPKILFFISNIILKNFFILFYFFFC